MIALLVGARHAGDDLGRMPRRSRPAIAARITRLDRRARARLVEIIERRALERRVEAGLNRERAAGARADRSEEHTSELQSLMRISYAVFCLKKKKNISTHNPPSRHNTPHHSN